MISPAHFVSAEDTAEFQGYETVEDMFGDAIHRGTCPACCSEGCIVESDGAYPHGFGSALLEADLI